MSLKSLKSCEIMDAYELLPARIYERISAAPISANNYLGTP